MRKVSILLALGFVLLPRLTWAQTPRSVQQQAVLFLVPANNGQHMVARTGQMIQLDLQALGSAGYGQPQVSTSNIRFENSALLMPPHPGGPVPLYLFRAISEGEAQIHVPRVDSSGFTVTIDVKPAVIPSPVRTDQQNTENWTGAWTNLLNQVRQDFVPSLRKTTSIEVGLVLANPGSSQATVTMLLLDADGKSLLLADKNVLADDCDRVSFMLPSGFELSPGRLYSIQLNESGALFGWKYVIGGYGRGNGRFNGKPLVNGARTTFLFRTFGVN